MILQCRQMFSSFIHYKIYKFRMNNICGFFVCVLVIFRTYSAIVLGELWLEFQSPMGHGETISAQGALLYFKFDLK